MKKKWLKFAAVLALIISFPANVHAEEFQSGDGWSVNFDGKEMNSTFKSTDIDDAIYQLQPGDTVNIHLSLSNLAEEDTDWYMTNEVLQSLEDSQRVADGGAYSYILTYIDADKKEQILYKSESVGGETSQEAGVGLHQATDSLKNYFYLGKLASQEKGEITLQVKLEGETQGNEYQDTLAKLQMNFAVEPTASAPENPLHRMIKTGDTSKILLFSLITLGAGLICVCMAVFGIRSRRKDKVEEGGRSK